MGLIERVSEYLEERLGVPTLWRRFTDRPIPKSVGWMHVFGSATLFLLVVQVATGTFLAFYYVPSPEHAYHSVSLISQELTFGWLVRGIHKWCASLVVIFVLLHLLRVLIMGAYKYPRELTWVVGTVLLVVVLAFAFTGYLLPWDQRAYWATVVGTHIAGYTPLVGHFVLEMLRGQPEVGVRTLGRFYAFHTLFLPILLFSLVAIHLGMVIRQGIAPLPIGRFASVKREEYNELYELFKEKGHPFYESMAKDMTVAALLMAVLVVLAWKLGAPLEDPADPASVTYVPRPEWYFYFLFELLWWFPGKWIPVATFWIPALLILALLFLPWLDRSNHRSLLRRPLTTTLTAALLVMAAFLTYRGVTAPRPPTVVAATRAQFEAEALSPRAQKGRQVYEEQACAACHSIGGVGGTAGPSLSSVGSQRDPEWLKRFIVNPAAAQPRSSMPSFDSLKPEELEELVDYLSTLK